MLRGLTWRHRIGSFCASRRMILSSTRRRPRGFWSHLAHTKYRWWISRKFEGQDNEKQTVMDDGSRSIMRIGSRSYLQADPSRMTGLLDCAVELGLALTDCEFQMRFLTIRVFLRKFSFSSAM